MSPVPRAQNNQLPGGASCLISPIKWGVHLTRPRSATREGGRRSRSARVFEGQAFFVPRPRPPYFCQKPKKGLSRSPSLSQRGGLREGGRMGKKFFVTKNIAVEPPPSCCRNLGGDWDGERQGREVSKSWFFRKKFGWKILRMERSSRSQVQVREGVPNRSTDRTTQASTAVCPYAKVAEGRM